MRRISLVGLVSFSLFGVLGCGSKFDNYCTVANDCVGGNDMDLDACLNNGELEEERASIYGCDAEFETYFECVDGSVDCDDERVEVDSDCGEDYEDLVDCIDDNSDLGDSKSGTSSSPTGGGNVCEEAAAICGGTGEGECTGSVAALAACIVAAGDCSTDTITSCSGQ